MAYWSTIRQFQMKTVSILFNRCYFQVHGVHNASHRAYLTRFLPQYQFGLRDHVRFFAAPLYIKPKKEEKVGNGPRLNEEITADVIRLVSDEGHWVISRSEALQRARILKLDLVEVQRNSKPPVCKLMDYHREKYKQQLKEKDRSKSKSEVALRKGDVKEIRFETKIKPRDLQIKADTVKRLMERGYRVKCTAFGNGKETPEELAELLSCFSPLIEDVCIVESGPRVEKKQAYIVVRHIKFGPSKKGGSGSGKKASQVSSASVSSSIPARVADNLDTAESFAETEDENVSEDENLDEVYGFKEATNGASKGMIKEQLDIEPKTLIAHSYPVESPHVGEHRYRRESTNRYSPIKSTDYNTGAMRNTQFDIKRPGGPPEHKRNSSLQDGPIKQDSFEPSSPRAASNFGIFSASRAENASVKQVNSAEGNRYKKVSSADSARNSSAFAGERVQRTSAADKDGQVRQGFPNRNVESQV